MDFDINPDAVKLRYDDLLSRYGDDLDFQIMTILAEDMYYKLYELMTDFECHGDGCSKEKASQIRELIDPIMTVNSEK
jgi:hypothetical protein